METEGKNNIMAEWRECRQSIYSMRLHDRSSEIRRVALMKMGRALEQFASYADDAIKTERSNALMWRTIAIISWLSFIIGVAAYVIF